MLPDRPQSSKLSTRLRTLRTVYCHPWTRRRSPGGSRSPHSEHPRRPHPSIRHGPRCRTSLSLHGPRSNTLEAGLLGSDTGSAAHSIPRQLALPLVARRPGPDHSPHYPTPSPARPLRRLQGSRLSPCGASAVRTMGQAPSRHGPGGWRKRVWQACPLSPTTPHRVVRHQHGLPTSPPRERALTRRPAG